MTLRHVVVFLGACAAAGCTPPARSTPLTAAQQTAIVDSVRTMLDSWREALSKRDFDRAASFYSSSLDFRWIENGEVRYTSRAEMAAAMKSMAPSLSGFQLTLNEATITPLAPGVAVVTASFGQKMTDTTGAMSGIAGAVSMTVVHADSGWRFLVGQASTLVPLSPVPAPKGRRT